MKQDTIYMSGKILFDKQYINAIVTVPDVQREIYVFPK